MADPGPRRRRRWRWLALGLLLVPVALVAGLPWLLGTPPGRRFLLKQANRVLAPGRLELQSIRFSWTGPTRMSGFVIRDHQGDRVVAAPTAVWDRSLWKILTDRPRYGTLRLDGAAVDAERRPDGLVDLYETLKPIFTDDPRSDLTIRINRGSLRFRSPGLAVPLTASRLDATLHRAPAPDPIAWRLDLADGSGPNPATLAIGGRFQRWRPEADGTHDLTLILHAHQWPVALDVAGVALRGRFEGQVRNHHHLGHWTISGRGQALGLDASTPAFAGDHLRLDRLGGEWMLAQTETGWAIDRLDLSSPIVRLRADGPVPAPPGSTTQIKGQLDLAALARQLPHALRLHDDLTIDRGTAGLKIVARTGARGETWDVEARLTDFAARRARRSIALSQPATLRAHLDWSGGGLKLDQLALETSFLNAKGSGDLDRGIAIHGTIDLDEFRRQAGDLIDLGNRELAGRGRFQVDYRRIRKTFAGHLTADLDGLRFAGLHRRDPVHLDLKADGPIAPSGLPTAWTNARLDLKNGDLEGQIVATATGGVRDLLIRGAVPLANQKGAGRIEFSSAGRWDGRTWEIHEATAALQPGAGASPSARPIRLQARGRYDSKAGTLVLKPIPGRSAGALALGREGLNVAGLDRSGLGLRADLGLIGDLGALRETVAAWIATDLPDLAGRWSSHWSVRQGDGLRFIGKIEAPDFAIRIGPGAPLGGPLALDVSGTYRDAADRIDLDELVLATPWATLEVAGRLDDPEGRRMADLKGSITPDFDALNALLADRVEPGARVIGAPGSFHLKGPMEGGSVVELIRGLDLGASLNLTGADIYGLKVGPIPLTVRTQAGRLVIDPIRTSLNGGRLALDPEIDRDDQGRVTIRLKPGSAIENAEVNDEVSRRFLSYAAPVLDRATRAHGLISARIARAEFPLGAGASRSAVVEGDIIFQNVEFAPGPLAADLLDLIGRSDATLKLDQPIVMSIADGKVHQHGLALPIGRLTRIEIDGTVDFERNLDLIVGIPLRPNGGGPELVPGGLIPGHRITIPVRGTLDRPQIDRQAFLAGLKDFGQRLGLGAGRAAIGLLERLAQPRDPEAMPRLLTPAERKARRLERRAQRQRGIGP